MDVSALYECTLQSIAGMMSFPEIVTKLRDGGVESYYADLLRHQNVFYFGTGEAHAVNYTLTTPQIPLEFDQAAVNKAIQTLQEKQISYREFLNRITAAGVQGYFVFLKGEKVVYMGRQGDQVVEPFINPPGESFGSVYNTLDI